MILETNCNWENMGLGLIGTQGVTTVKGLLSQLVKFWFTCGAKVQRVKPVQEDQN